MPDKNKFNAVRYINERTYWSISRLLLGLEAHGVRGAEAQRLLRDFVDAQCSK